MLRLASSAAEPAHLNMTYKRSSKQPCFHLRGDIEGRTELFQLSEGTYEVGSSRRSQIRLPVAGVSRRHAVVRVDGRGLVIEDQDSKNGTTIDGQQIQRATAGDGARLAFGPMELHVEAVAPGAGLAIRFESNDESSSALEADTATSATQVPEGEGEESLELIDDLLRCLHQGPEPLRRLASEFGLEGACLVSWSPSNEPLALSIWGRVHSLPLHSEIQRLPARLEPDGEWRCGTFEGKTPGLLIAHWDSSRRAHGLVLWRSTDVPKIAPSLLRIALRMLLLPRSEDRRPAKRHHATEVATLRFPDGYLPGGSTAMRALYQQMTTICQQRHPVLLHGETGVGKGLLARTLHASSPNPDLPFVTVSCAAIPENLLESEMFGVVKGAATGVAARPGYFARAQGGTLFLDEIGELSPALQAKLLRALQENEIQPVGGSPRAIDVWVIAATNVDLHSDRLRRDLYYRLSSGLLEIPPLRQCRKRHRRSDPALS